MTLLVIPSAVLPRLCPSLRLRPGPGLTGGARLESYRGGRAGGRRGMSDAGPRRVSRQAGGVWPGAAVPGQYSTGRRAGEGRFVLTPPPMSLSAPGLPVLALTLM